jgi:hypothetical protein
MTIEKEKICKQCGRKHRITFYFLLDPEVILKLQKLSCHLPLDNYLGSIITENETIDVFLESDVKHFCSLCGKWISRETSIKYNGLCSKCAMLYFYWDDDI